MNFREIKQAVKLMSDRREGWLASQLRSILSNGDAKALLTVNNDAEQRERLIDFVLSDIAERNLPLPLGVKAAIVALGKLPAEMRGKKIELLEARAEAVQLTETAFEQCLAGATLADVLQLPENRKLQDRINKNAERIQALEQELYFD